MKDIHLDPAPEIPPPPGGDDQWRRDKAAFARLHSSLLEQYCDRFVAVYQGKVVDSGDEPVELAARVYEKIGYVPLYIGRVSNEPAQPLRISGPRILSK